MWKHGTKTVPESKYLTNNNGESVSELSTSETNCRLVELRNNSVDGTMPNNGKRSTRKRRRRSSRGRGNQQDGDRPVGVCHPRVQFLPRFCRHCQENENVTAELRDKLYLSRNAMNKHTVLKHDCWYQPKRDEYVPIAPEDLERVRARYRSWQSHRSTGQPTEPKRSRLGTDDECRPATSAPATTSASAPTPTSASAPAVTTRDLSCLLYTSPSPRD